MYYVSVCFLNECIFCLCMTETKKKGRHKSPVRIIEWTRNMLSLLDSDPPHKFNEKPNQMSSRISKCAKRKKKKKNAVSIEIYVNILKLNHYDAVCAAIRFCRMELDTKTAHFQWTRNNNNNDKITREKNRFNQRNSKEWKRRKKKYEKKRKKQAEFSISISYSAVIH